MGTTSVTQHCALNHLLNEWRSVTINRYFTFFISMCALHHTKRMHVVETIESMQKTSGCKTCAKVSDNCSMCNFWMHQSNGKTHYKEKVPEAMHLQTFKNCHVLLPTELRDRFNQTTTFSLFVWPHSPTCDRFGKFPNLLGRMCYPGMALSEEC